MFNNFFSSLKLAQNVEKIKTTVASAYTVVTKVVALLKYLNAEFQISDKLKVYIPAILSALVTLLSVLEKVAPLIGVSLVKAQSAATLTKDELLEELQESLKDLNDLLK